MAARPWCSWIEDRLAALSVNGILRRRRGFDLLAPFGRRHQALPFALLHELVVFRGTRTGRSIGRQATGPCRDGVAHAARELLIDRPASAQGAARKRERDDRGDMAGADRHRQEVSTLTFAGDRFEAARLLPTNR